MNAALAVFDALASRAAGALLAGVAYAVPIAIVAWMLVRLSTRCNAATRYGIWLAALVATLALDPLPGHPWIAASSASAAGTGSSVHRAALLPGGASGPTSDVQDAGAARNAVSIAAASRSTVQPRATPLLTLPGDWAFAFFIAWYLTATILIVRLIVGHLRLQRIKDRAAPLSTWHQSRLAEWLRLSGGSRVPRLLVSDAIEIPVAIGLFHPAIVVPANLVDHLTDAEFDQIGMHELAHVRRLDDWTNLLQKIAEALLFFSPAVYFIGRQLSIEREVACDDWVVSTTGGARPYANCLTRLAELAATNPASVLPSLGAVFSKKQIFTRIERLLDRTRNSRPLVAKSAAWAAAAGLLTVLLFAAQMTPLVAVSASHAVDSMVAASVASADLRTAMAVVTSTVASNNAPSKVPIRTRSAACAHHITSHSPTILADIRAVGAPRHQKTPRVHDFASLVITDATSVAPPDSVSAELAALANAPGEEERLAAVSALEHSIGQARVRAALLHALEMNSDEAVRLNIVAALAPYADRSDVLRVFGSILREGNDEPVALNIIAAIAPAAAQSAAMESLTKVLNSTKDEAVGLNALAAVAPYSGHRTVQVALIGLMRNGRSEALRLNAIAALTPHAQLILVHRALVDALDTNLADAERANIKAALGIAPAATEVASAGSTWMVHGGPPSASAPGSERLAGDVSVKGTVRIENVHGNIEVIGWDRASGEVDAAVEGDPNAIRVSGKFEGGDLRVSSTQIDQKADVAVNYVVHVPAGVHVIVTTVSGNIIVRGITGAVDATSTEGDVDVNGTHGPVSATTTSGNVRATGLRGDSTLTSVSGDVHVEFDELDGGQAVKAESTAGTVSIVVPANSSAQITAQTVSGEIHSCDGRQASSDVAGASIVRTTGNGSAKVDLRAVSGDITITSH
ncbi:MAG TPA: M56 family metallopeptidase [Candidatus Eremiobacteraceae bacterium]|nr:M56 family metallopeptidase [Candidatus Eremiobacteraceae bacterium]